MIAVCWQVSRDSSEEITVAVYKSCHNIGLRKQNPGCLNSWDCWHFTLLVWLSALQCVDVGSAYCHILYHH